MTYLSSHLTLGFERILYPWTFVMCRETMAHSGPAALVARILWH